jgi:hypothetical protein
MPQDVDIFSYLRVIAGAFTVLAGLYYLLSHVDQQPEEERTEEPARAPWKPAPGQYDLVPRTLPQNPFTASNRVDVLAREIEAAAEASVRLSRTVGLIYFEFPALAAFEAENGVAGADSLIASLAQDFRRALRETDHVAIVNGRQIIVSICLLAGRKDLETVASRLTAAARRRDLVDEGAPSLPAGIAIYPLDGYGGLDLIESARRHYRELRAEISAPERRAEAFVTAPPAHPHHTRKRSRRRPSRKAQAPQPIA